MLALMNSKGVSDTYSTPSFHGSNWSDLLLGSYTLLCDKTLVTLLVYSAYTWSRRIGGGSQSGQFQQDPLTHSAGSESDTHCSLLPLENTTPSL